ncbi:tryptophan halogenase [Hephaestia caeni]|uniref:Tryptophan halogenase n=1 Tax=Hephaestia caeni TaxID=645617 RepID=A0A397P978_9SPHN|nr:tryptophan halogenase family protein [Hephaestia caeni]RIA43705.1 tryptophan halogenase [Hephaestia caeni]
MGMGGNTGSGATAPGGTAPGRATDQDTGGARAPIERLVIVGGGTAGWMAAAAFSRYLNNGRTKVTLIESAEIGTIGVGEATIPPILSFNKMLGINENEFIAATQGTFKAGIEFVDWGAIGERYVHPFGYHGHEIHGVAFHQLYLRARAQRQMPPISDWSMSAAAIRHGRFARPGTGASFPLDQLYYAYQFDAALYARYLRGYAERGGVERIEGKVVDVALDGESGFVTDLTMADGRIIAGDLFLDCSGFRGLLIEQALKTGYDDWSRWLPCNRAVAVATENVVPPEPLTRATARARGWQWRIPLQHRMGNGLVYSSAYLSDDEARDTLMANLEGPALADPRTLSFTTGRRRLSWNRNVVTLGLSSGFVEPLESTSIHLVQAGIAKLIALFPDKRCTAVERDEYNRAMKDLAEDIRDFVILHFHATRRDDSPFWDYCRTMEPPDSLARKIALFREKGRVFRDNFELFATPSWVAVMFGQGIWPEGYDPIADALDESRVDQAMAQMRRDYEDAALRLPSQAEFIARCCAAPAMPMAAAS